MPVAALPGNVRLRKFQIGKETTFGTVVPATIRTPGSYTPNDDPHVTFPTADTGTLDEALPPYRLAGDWGGTYTGTADFDFMPRIWAATLLGGVTPTGGADKTWTFQPASTTQDPFEIFSAEWGDETTDQRGYGSGTINHLKLTFPEDLSPAQISADWYFASLAYPQAVTGGLSVAPSPWLYAAHTGLYIDDTSGSIGSTALTNTLHGGDIDIANNLDRKRFLNGSNAQSFGLSGFGRGKRDIVATFTFAKSTVGIAEAVKWLNADPTKRYIAVRTISPTVIPTTGTHYSQEVRFAGYWTAKTEGTYGTSNTTNVLTCHNIHDAVLGYPYLATVVCGLTAL